MVYFSIIIYIISRKKSNVLSKQTVFAEEDEWKKCFLTKKLKKVQI